MAESFSNLLQVEFAKLQDGDSFKKWAHALQLEPEDWTENQVQAMYLGISPSQLSKVRRGLVRLTKHQATKIAEKLRPDSSEAQEQLQAQFFAAASEDRRRASTGPAPFASLEGVLDLFRRLGTEGALLCVEYRDRPRASPNAKYPEFAKPAGRAVAKGCHFAMFQPFGHDFSAKGDSYHAREVWDYLHKLWREVRQTHDAILKAAMSECPEDEKGIRSRLVLYERISTPPFLGTGIQSRLFYAEIPKEVAGEDQEVWEWVAGENEDVFVKRDPNRMPVEVIQEQFFPVTRYWNKYGKLPRTTPVLESAASEFADLAEAKFKKGTFPWQVWLG